MMAINAETYPDRTVEQYAENVRLTAIKNITYKDVTRKAPLFQRLLKQENTKEYKIHIMNEEEDLAQYNFHFTFGLEIRQLMEDVGLGLDSPKMRPWRMACAIRTRWTRKIRNGLKLSRTPLGAYPGYKRHEILRKKPHPMV